MDQERLTMDHHAIHLFAKELVSLEPWKSTVSDECIQLGGTGSTGSTTAGESSGSSCMAIPALSWNLGCAGAPAAEPTQR